MLVGGVSSLKMKTIFGQMFVCLSLWVACHASSILPIIPTESILSGGHSNGPVLNQAQEGLKIPQGTSEFHERMNSAYLMFKANRKNGRDTSFGVKDDAIKDKQHPEMWLEPVTGSGVTYHDQIHKKDAKASGYSWYVLYPATAAVVGYVVGYGLGELYGWGKKIISQSKPVHHMEQKNEEKSNNV